MNVPWPVTTADFVQTNIGPHKKIFGILFTVCLILKPVFLPWAVSTTIHTSNMGEIITGIFDGFHIESRFQEIPARKSDLQIYCANVIHT